MRSLCTWRGRTARLIWRDVMARGDELVVAPPSPPSPTSTSLSSGLRAIGLVTLVVGHGIDVLTWHDGRM